MLFVAVVAMCSLSSGQGPVAKQPVTVELYYGGAWHDVPVYTRDNIAITRGTAPEGGGITPATAALTIDDRTGAYDPSNPFSVLYGKVGRNTPIRIKLAADIRFTGEVTSWKPRRSIVEVDQNAQRGDAWVIVEAAGQLQRYGQGAPVKRSAMTRALLPTASLGWWPLELDLTATTAGTLPGRIVASPVGPAVRPPLQMTTDGVTGTAALVDLSNGTRVDLTVPEHVLVPATGYQVEFVARWQPGGFTGGLSVDAVRLLFANTQPSATTVDRVDIETDTDHEAFLFAAPTSGSSDRDDAVAEGDVYDGASRHFRVRVYQSGADVLAEMWINGVSRATVALTATTLTNLTTISLNFVGELGTKIPAIGQVLVYQSATAGPGAEASTGYVDEPAAEQFLRLCAEEGITGTVVGTAADSKPMGPQPVASFLELLAALQRTDDGMVYDTRDSLGLTYRTGRSRINQTPALDLTFPDHIAPPLDPSIDDLGTRNDVTVKSPTGLARSVEETGPMSVLTPPDGVGLTATSIDANPADDTSLPDLARWYRARGTIPDPRYPRIVVDLVATPGIDAAVTALDIGDVATLTRPGRALARLQVPGYTELIGSHTRTVTLVTVPDTVHGNVGVYGTSAKGTKYGARTTVLAEDLTDVETAADVNTGTDIWITTASHPSKFPFNVDIGGITYSCTAITGAHPNLTFTLVRLATDKPHSTGDQVTVTAKGRYGY